ncbi:MAG: translation initiation factor IF-2 [Bacteroidales bacterium]
MAEIRLNKLLKQFNIGLQTLVDFLASKGVQVENNPNLKISDECIPMLQKQFGKDLELKEASEKVDIKLTEILEKSAKKQQDSKKEEEEEEPEQEMIIKNTSFIPSDKSEDIQPVKKAEESDLPQKTEPKQEMEPVIENQPKVEPVPNREPEPTQQVQSRIVQEQENPKAAPTAEPQTEPKKDARTANAESIESTSGETAEPSTIQTDKEIEAKTSEDKPKAEPEKVIAEAIHQQETRQENALTENKPEEKVQEKNTDETAKDPKHNEVIPEIQSNEKAMEEKSRNENALTEKVQQNNRETKEDESLNENAHVEKRQKDFHKESERHNDKDAKAEVAPTPATRPQESEVKEAQKPEDKKPEERTGLKILGKMDVSQFERRDKHKKRERIAKGSQKVDVDKLGKENDQNSGGKKDAQKGGQKGRNNQNNNGGSNSNGSGNNNRNQRPNQNNAANNNGGNNVQGKGGKRRGNNRNDRFRPAMTEAEQEEMQKEIQKQVKETYAKMNESKSKTNFGAKYRKEKREIAAQKSQEEIQEAAKENKTLKVTEFVTVNDLATLMNNTPVNKVIAACMNLGLMVSINQRLDAEALVLVAEEFGYKVDFVTADLSDEIKQDTEVAEDDSQLVTRPPIITVMGHVDHGKTSLLDYIRKSNVIAGEAGGITQHIGAYNVVLSSGRRITFLDTPGHEAFTAMRARGAQLTDLAIIIIAADDTVMPQTKEAINHAQAAGVPMVFAINKIDKPGAQPEKIRQQLAQMNILVEDWGGKYQCQEISAKKGVNVDKLLEKVLLETDLLDLKANPKKPGVGAVIESSLDKGRGYLATVLVQDGTVKVGDVILSGCYYGRVKAMFNERGQKIDQAGPSTPVSILGLDGAPSAGDKFAVLSDEKEAKAIANKREQLIRIQDIKTQKHMTLEEIGRRIAIGNFKELNVIVKGDVDGSVEALSDSLIKLSTEEVKVNVIHKAVGAISESDVLLAEASDAVIVGFQVRPTSEVRKLAEKAGIEIRLYSIIYDAINDVKEGIEGMLEPEKKEEVTATAEVKQTFKISKVGTIAGCIVRDGKMTKNTKARLIRDGIVIYTGDLSSLKRGKDDVKEVVAGMECGIGIENFNDIKDGDTIEAFHIVEIKKTL